MSEFPPINTNQERKQINQAKLDKFQEQEEQNEEQLEISQQNDSIPVIEDQNQTSDNLNIPKQHDQEQQNPEQEEEEQSEVAVQQNQQQLQKQQQQRPLPQEIQRYIKNFIRFKHRQKYGAFCAILVTCFHIAVVSIVGNFIDNYGLKISYYGCLMLFFAGDLSWLASLRALYRSTYQFYLELFCQGKLYCKCSILFHFCGYLFLIVVSILINSLIIYIILVLMGGVFCGTLLFQRKKFYQAADYMYVQFIDLREKYRVFGLNILDILIAEVRDKNL